MSMSLITVVWFIGVPLEDNLDALLQMMCEDVGDTFGIRECRIIDANDGDGYIDGGAIAYNYLDFDAFRRRYDQVFNGKDELITVVIQDERNDRAYIYNRNPDAEMPVLEYKERERV